MNQKKKDVLIIGSGPAGLLCSILASQGRRVTLIEKPSKTNVLSKRILVSGNGRANFFNEDLFSASFEKDLQFLYRNEKHDYAKELFSYLESQGFAYTMEGKLYYPYFRKSECLHSFLMEKMKKVEVLYGKALQVHPERNSITLLKDSKEEEIFYSDLVIAIGGRSFDREEYSYDLLDSLHVSYFPYQSMLCPVRTKERIPSYLQKQRLKGRLSLLSDQKVLYEEEGEILFKEDGISGICVFDSTKYLLDEKRRNPKASFSYSFDYASLLDGNKISLSCYPEFLKKYLKEKGIEKEKPLSFTFHSLYPFKESQASYGGIRLDEINKETLSLKKYPHIYAIGEMLDADLICGGYNIGTCMVEGYRIGKELTQHEF